MEGGNLFSLLVFTQLVFFCCFKAKIVTKYRNHKCVIFLMLKERAAAKSKSALSS